MIKGVKVTIAVVLILLIGSAGTAYYFLKIKEYDVADEKVKEITESEYKIELPDTSTADPSSVGGSHESEENPEEIVDGEGDQTTNETGSQKNADSKNTGSSETVSSSNPKQSNSTSGTKKENKQTSLKNSGPKKPTVTAESIKAAYRPVFESLEAQANTKIDGLVTTAYSEYKTKKENGESVSITYFYRKYSSAGQELESKTDETFHYVYKALEEDLEKRGFNRSEASEFKTQYEKAKSARESALIEKAKSAL